MCGNEGIWGRGGGGDKRENLKKAGMKDGNEKSHSIVCHPFERHLHG